MARGGAPVAVRPPARRLSSPRRSSFARRDSNLALVGALVAGVLVAFALVLLVLERVQPELGAELRGGVLDLMSPVILAAQAPRPLIEAIDGRLSEHWRAVSRNRRLEAEREILLREANRVALLEREVARLSRLLQLEASGRRAVAHAQASAMAPSGARRHALVAAGRRQGVGPRMAVVAPEGLAGRVIESGAAVSRVLLLTDADSRVPVVVARTGWTGMVQGTGQSAELVWDSESGLDRLRPGDRLVTSGDGGLFPPGIPVGIVLDAESATPRVRLAANPAALSTVRIEPPWMPPPPEPAPVPAADTGAPPQPAAGRRGPG